MSQVDDHRQLKRPRTLDGADQTALITLPSAGAESSSHSLASPTMLLEKAHTGLVLGLAFSPDGCTLATCSKDRTVCA